MIWWMYVFLELFRLVDDAWTLGKPNSYVYTDHERSQPKASWPQEIVDLDVVYIISIHEHMSLQYVLSLYLHIIQNQNMEQSIL